MIPVLSPYLRTYIQAGTLCFEHAVAGRKLELDPVQVDVVRALWPRTERDGDDPVRREEASRALDEIAERVPPRALAEALVGLMREGVVYQDLEACHADVEALLSRVPPVPFLDQVELTNHCPMTCRFCPRGREGGLSRPKGFMARALFTRIVQQANPRQRFFRLVELHHLGESLLHPDLPGCVREATEARIPTELSANPSLLKPDLAAALVRAGLGRLVLSLDGMDDETSTALRGRAARYASAERNIDALLDLCAKAPRPPRVVVQMLDLHRNRHQREAFLARFGSTGLPFVQAYVKHLEGDDPDLGRPTSPPLRLFCLYPWRSVVVLWDGRVVPCCRDADASIVLGDLASQTLEEIWRGEAVAELRELHRRNDFPDGHPCKGCSWMRANFVRSMPERHPSNAWIDPLS